MNCLYCSQKLLIHPHYSTGEDNSAFICENYLYNYNNKLYFVKDRIHMQIDIDPKNGDIKHINACLFIDNQNIYLLADKNNFSLFLFNPVQDSASIIFSSDYIPLTVNCDLKKLAQKYMNLKVFS